MKRDLFYSVGNDRLVNVFCVTKVTKVTKVPSCSRNDSSVETTRNYRLAR
jgi:hypothetical protein